MKYVPQSLEVASRWVDVCERSLGIARAEVASMYANMCGFGSWDLMAAHMNVGQPALTDEEIQGEMLEARHAYYRDVLVDTFFMNPCFVDYFIHIASPSSQRQPAVFSVDHSKIYSSSDHDSKFASNGFGRLLNTYAKQYLGDELGSDFDFNTFSDQLRLHSGVYPGHWYNLVASLGWNVIEDSYVDEYTYSHPSLFVQSATRGVIPIYIVSLTRIPLESADEMASLVLNHIQTNVTQKQVSDHAMLFWGSMLSKQVNERWYTHPGMVFQNGEWRDFLINQHLNNADLAFDMVESLDINNPPLGHEDQHLALARGFGCMKLNVDDPNYIEFSQLTNPSGWSSLIPMLKSN